MDDAGDQSAALQTSDVEMPFTKSIAEQLAG
jgi:hypothetical protein